MKNLVRPRRGMRLPSRRSGFTLAEILVVVVILGLLATLVVPHLLDRLQWARVETTKINMARLGGSIEDYAILNSGRQPSTLEELTTPDENGMRFVSQRSELRDAWKTPYAFAPTPTDPQPFEFASHGADRVAGGEGFDADIDYWALER